MAPSAPARVYAARSRRRAPHRRPVRASRPGLGRVAGGGGGGVKAAPARAASREAIPRERRSSVAPPALALRIRSSSINN